MTKQTTLAIAATLLMGVLPLHAQTTTTTAKPKTVAKTPVKKVVKKPVETKEQQAIRELQEKSAAQQSQIDSLNRQLTQSSTALTEAQSTAASAQTSAATATAQAQQAQAAAAAAQTQNADQLNGLKSTVTDLQTANTGLATTISATKTELNDKIESPTTIHYKGVTIQPVAFFAFEGVWRQRSVNSDINTPLNSIPFPSANQGHVSELNFSGRQSRLGGLFTAPTGKVTLSGYFESDFLGTGTSSNNNQSNSYVFRIRQMWGKAETQSGFAVTGGQTWSLVTENRRSTDVRTEIQPMTIDPQYTVGYTWTRQPGIRVQQRFGDLTKSAFTLALSLEQAQITNFTAGGTNPAQYFFGGIGQNGGLYNAAATNGGTSDITAYANNAVPDLVVKAAFDVPAFHFEIGGIGRWFRDYYLPVTTTFTTPGTPIYSYGTTYHSSTTSGGGGFASARVYLGKVSELGVQAMAGPGIGRYGSAQLADVTLRPDETLEPIKSYHGLVSWENHITPKLDVFAYYGGEYAQRTVYTTAAGNLIGYGPRNLNDSGCYNLPAALPGTVGNAGFQGGLGAVNCTSPTKYIQEGVIGFQYRPITSPKYGKLQYSVTYSLLQRQLWSGSNIPASGPITSPTSARAQDSMIHVQMRYYIP